MNEEWNIYLSHWSLWERDAVKTGDIVSCKPWIDNETGNLVLSLSKLPKKRYEGEPTYHSQIILDKHQMEGIIALYREQYGESK